MEKSTYIGLFLAAIAVGVGMVLKGASLTSLLNPAAILIIFVGTAASLFIGFPMDDLKAVPKLFKIMFTSQTLVSKSELIAQIGEWATASRREGLLSLESKAEEIEDEFLRNGMRMVIDGNDPEFIREVLMENISAMEERHRQGALIFTQAGTYAPTLGVLGAVVGLIAALGNLNEIEALGHLISAAFVATLLGIFSGYVLWHPMANKLKQKSKKETQIKMMMAEGLLAIQAGEPVLSINQRLAVFLTPTERKAMEEEKA
ncbi:flagellar motor stator protein MotA [Desulfosporosinus sp.]|uniref:flagellar motor stator protein MotA n=1 Tax=Desulfosporosinus sp. TaxID=157907 RepID=UPI0025C04130|nr:flagellar motor stator protein MotA [Desulfosporosinus sp.]MBC2722591.1 flagellar motor stator protein MotA [Desulfosporosinus sp.]MBC2727701.1 flagellar motor stator protein MotA [Desulfosporosinus sp.]